MWYRAIPSTAREIWYRAIPSTDKGERKCVWCGRRGHGGAGQYRALTEVYVCVRVRRGSRGVVQGSVRGGNRHWGSRPADMLRPRGVAGQSTHTHVLSL
eukprot:177113-Rhodomonas_salina.1